MPAVTGLARVEAADEDDEAGMGLRPAAEDGSGFLIPEDFELVAAGT